MSNGHDAERPDALPDNTHEDGARPDEGAGGGGGGHEDSGHGRDEDPLSGYFFFPCFDGDDGTRPAPAFVCSWRSPALLVNGAPYDGQVLTPNQPVQLSAVVANTGALSAPALVTILYAPFSAQFTDDLQIAAQFADFWLAGETKTTQATEWIVPAGLSSHICLLAAVDSLVDPIPTPLPQSVADRHYAQCNLTVQVVAPGKSIAVPLWLGQGAGLGLDAGQTMHARVRADLSAGAEAFARSRRLHLDVELAQQIKPTLEGGAKAARGGLLEFDAREGDHRAQLVAQMPKTARAGQAVILTVEQFATTRRDRQPRLVGSLAVVLIAGQPGVRLPTVAATRR